MVAFGKAPCGEARDRLNSKTLDHLGAEKKEASRENSLHLTNTK